MPNRNIAAEESAPPGGQPKPQRPSNGLTSNEVCVRLQADGQVAAGCSAAIIDVGGGESTLVDDLLAGGYENLTVLDISQTALNVTRKRLGNAAKQRLGVITDTS